MRTLILCRLLCWLQTCNVNHSKGVIVDQFYLFRFRFFGKARKDRLSHFEENLAGLDLVTLFFNTNKTQPHYSSGVNPFSTKKWISRPKNDFFAQKNEFSAQKIDFEAHNLALENQNGQTVTVKNKENLYSIPVRCHSRVRWKKRDVLYCITDVWFVWL